MGSLVNSKTRDVESVIEKLFSTINQFASVEEATKALSKGMCQEFTTSGKSDLVLSRVFHSFDYQLLPDEIQKAGEKTLGSKPTDESKFLVLIGTYGDNPDWQDRRKSGGHKAIPLNRTTVKSIPMVARLFQQVGFDLGIVLGEKKEAINMGGVVGSYGVFHVPEALGSPFIPAQDFVKVNGVKSVLGTGVMLPEGDVGIYIGFCRVHITQEMASQFASLMSLFWQKIYTLKERGMF